MASVVYNLTTNISEDVVQDWLEWIEKVYSPLAFKTGAIKSISVLRVHGQEDGSSTFAVQHECYSMDDYERFQQHSLAELNARIQEVFGEHVHVFATLLSVVWRANSTTPHLNVKD
jgi:hypothetical protein